MRSKDTLGISHSLKVVEHELEQAIAVALEKMGLTPPQYGALSYLEEHCVGTNADLARWCSVTPQTMNKILQNLERDGFVTKAPHPEHGLKIEFTCTPKAKKVICQAHVKVNDIETAMVEGLPKKGVQNLQDVLQCCLRNLRKL